VSLTVACVLRFGGEYGPDHVARLRDGVARHLSLKHRFVCLSDVPVPCERIPLKHHWPGWFSKIELFRRENLPGDVFYLDLDTCIVGPLDDLVRPHRFTVLRNFWVDANHPRIGSGLMAWGVDLSLIYERFKADARALMDAAVVKENWGDQGIIQRKTPIQPQRWQDVAPGRVVSWKMHCKAGVPPRASIVCFHGQPRPWETPLWSEVS
jgi:hypothetical protein